MSWARKRRDATVRERHAVVRTEPTAVFALSFAVLRVGHVLLNRILRFASVRGVPLPYGRVSALLAAIILCCSASGEDFAPKFTALADQWEAQGKTAEAKVARDWTPSTKNRQILYSFLPDDAPPPSLDPEFTAEFQQLRVAYAEELFKTAYKQVMANNEADGFQTLHHVLRESPDHGLARLALGHWRRKDKAWSTDFGEQIAGVSGTTPHPKLGWPARSYSRVTSSHFEIVTNGNVADARKVAAELEQLYCAWRQVFYTQVALPGALAARVKNGTMEPIFPDRKTKHKVVLFKAKADYEAKLRPQLPGIENTTGLYFDKDRTSYLYVAPPTDRVGA